ncbi:MAG: AraC family transcriptional regulator [Hymenobacteraceae bacterium]|nr:AraC family transcriptional regulator [Hymenobacteraceae bacterium]
MKVIQFTVPVTLNDSVVVQEDIQPYFYNYLHRHKELQLTLILKGEGTLIVGNYTQRFSEGDIYVIGANQPHLFKSEASYYQEVQEDRVHAIHIFFDYECKLHNLFDVPEMETIRHFLESTQHGLQLPERYFDNVSRIIKKINRNTGLKRLLSCIRLLQVLARDVQGWKSLSTGFPNTPFAEPEDVRMNNIFQFTIQHYAENITLEKIASEANMTPHAFCKYFKKHTQKTYMSFLNEVRINEACKKIIHGDFDSISSVAYATGFNSAINFNKVFKKATGKSPSEYIREYRYRQDKALQAVKQLAS